MTDTLLTQIESPGTVIVPHNYANRRALAIHIEALKAAGHAIVVDETFEAGREEPLGDLRVYHYRTCKQCIALGRV